MKSCLKKGGNINFLNFGTWSWELGAGAISSRSPNPKSWCSNLFSDKISIEIVGNINFFCWNKVDAPSIVAYKISIGILRNINFWGESCFNDCFNCFFKICNAILWNINFFSASSSSQLPAPAPSSQLQVPKLKKLMFPPFFRQDFNRNF